MRVVRCVIGLAAILLVAAPPAAAQYPGTTSTTTAPTTQTLGALAVGGTTTVASCGFRAGAVGTSLNGQAGPADTAETDGCARTTVAVLSASQVRVEGVTLAAQCANNTLTVTGTDPAGASRVVSTTFGIACPATGGTGLPRTGAMILRWSLAGVALLAVGALLVLAGRRRSGPTAA